MLFRSEVVVVKKKKAKKVVEVDDDDDDDDDASSAGFGNIAKVAQPTVAPKAAPKPAVPTKKGSADLNSVLSAFGNRSSQAVDDED